MIPGAPHPMMAGGGDPLDEYARIERSVRNRRSAGAHWSRTFPSAGSLTTWTLRMWLKRADLINTLRLFGIGNDSNAISQHSASLSSSGELQLYLGDGGGSTVGSVLTAGKWRDPGAHYDVHLVWDTTNPVASERLRVYIDGERQTAGSSTYPAQNTPGLINTAVLHCLGALSASSSLWFDGQFSWVIFVDGQALEPSSFAMPHPRTDQWRPKSKAVIRAAVAAGGGARNGWGTNGFFLPFDDTTSLTTLGYDRSQSDTDTTGNNWTDTNVSLTAGASYDSLLDTPTNVFCTLDCSVEVGSTTRSITNGALDISSSYTSGVANYGTIPLPTSGKWYWEVTVGTVDSANDSPIIGVMRFDNPGASGYDYTNAATYRQNGQKQISGGVYAYGAGYTTNDVIGVAVDTDGGTVTFYKNGTSQGVALSGLLAQVKPAIISSVNTTTAFFNFGQRPFAHTPPAGFKALCTKNLAFPPVPKPSNSFVAVTDSGANILATLAAASPWNDWIRIFKRRDSAEGWRWQFSDDSANYLDSSSTAAKAAFPALAGASYVGYAFRVAAANGVATGRLVHTSGAADVVLDNLGNTRKAIILKNEATGVWYFYHPDLTAGKLLYLEQVTAETTDATIGSVTSNGFTVAAALASGTYRWMTIAESSIVKLLKYNGNGISDGPSFYEGHASAFNVTKKTNGIGDDWQTHDIATSPRNVAGASLRLNSSAAETSGTYLMDMNSSSSKLQQGGSNGNESGGTYVGISIAASTFRYSNAR